MLVIRKLVAAISILKFDKLIQVHINTNSF